MKEELVKKIDENTYHLVKFFQLRSIKLPENYEREGRIIVDYHDNVPNSLIRDTARNKLGSNIIVGTRSG